jgi:hypothetical protein
VAGFGAGQAEWASRVWEAAFAGCVACGSALFPNPAFPARPATNRSAYDGRADLAAMLLAAGANPNVRSASGSTPMHDAAACTYM